MTLFYEDVAVGDVRESGSRTLTETQVLEFAERYDPQPFHVDPVAAEESMYGGLIASGWHTAAVTMRMLVESLLTEAATVGARGVDELRWPRPVRPGDALRVRTEIVDKAVETSERGLVSARSTTHNGEDEAVFSMVGRIMFERRDGD